MRSIDAKGAIIRIAGRHRSSCWSSTCMETSARRRRSGPRVGRSDLFEPAMWSSTWARTSASSRGGCLGWSGPAGHVHAVEPDPVDGAGRLARLAARRQNLTVHAVALSNVSGEARLHVPINDARAARWVHSLDWAPRRRAPRDGRRPTFASTGSTTWTLARRISGSSSVTSKVMSRPCSRERSRPSNASSHTYSSRSSSATAKTTPVSHSISWTRWVPGVRGGARRVAASRPVRLRGASVGTGGGCLRPQLLVRRATPTSLSLAGFR